MYLVLLLLLRGGLEEGAHEGLIHVRNGREVDRRRVQNVRSALPGAKHGLCERPYSRKKSVENKGGMCKHKRDEEGRDADS